MFCPECGIEERQANQFCRGCGADMRRVRSAIASPDSITAASVTARDEIGRAIAARIRETGDAYELKKVAEDVLPQITKFLESPEEKRMRRLRVGMIIASVGLGVAVALSIVAAFALGPKDRVEYLFLAGLGFVTLFIGIGFILNGYFLTVPKKETMDHSTEGNRQRELDALYERPELPQPAAQSFVSSVTERTTRHLEKDG